MTLTEGKHRREFLVSEGNGGISWEQGIVTAGQNLIGGQVCALVDGELVAHDAAADSNGIPTLGAVVLDDDVDATAGAKPGVYLARLAEVNLSDLTYPAETSVGGEEAAIIAALKLNNIIARLAVVE